MCCFKKHQMVVLNPRRSKTPQCFYFIVINFRSVYAGRFQLNHRIFQYVLRILVSKGTIHYWKMSTCQECHGRARCLQRCKQILESVHSPGVRDRHRDWWFPDELEHQSLLLSCQPEIVNKVCSDSWRHFLYVLAASTATAQTRWDCIHSPRWIQGVAVMVRDSRHRPQLCSLDHLGTWWCHKPSGNTASH